MNAEFKSKLRTENIDGSTEKLIDDLRYYSAELRGTVIAPAGFVTDFASIPRFLWSLLPKQGRWSEAAVIHDAAYRGELRTPSGNRIHLIRALADDVFLEAMAVSGVNPFVRTLMYRAVRVFGRRAYTAADRLRKAGAT